MKLDISSTMKNATNIPCEVKAMQCKVDLMHFGVNCGIHIFPYFPNKICLCIWNGQPDRPSYLLWPIRGGNGQFLPVDPWSGNLEAAKFVKPIGIEHFFDAFSLEKKRPLKVDAASALNIPVNEVSDSLVVSQDKAKRFELTPVWAPAEPPTKRAKTAEVRLSSASNVPMPPTNDENEKGSSDEEDSDSSGSNSDVSSQDDSSDVSDLEKFDEAYTDFGALTKGVDPRTLERDGSANPNEEVPGIDLPGGMKARDLRRDWRNASSSGPSLREPSFRKTSAAWLLTCTPHTPGSTRQPSHVEGAHDDAQLLGSCECCRCGGIGFFELSKDFILREFFHMPAPTTTEESDLCLCQENEVGGHACTGCNALGLNRTV